MTTGEETTIKSLLLKQGIAIVAAGVIGFGSAGFAAYSSIMTEQARSEEVHRHLEADISALESSRDRDAMTVNGLAGDMAAVKQALGTGQRDTRDRLTRIEAALDAINSPRRR